MVDVMGHVAFGLLFALPAWFIWTGRASAAFVVLAGASATVPDIDVFLSKVFPNAVHHHGVTHTVLAVVIGALILAAIVAALFTDSIDDWIDSERFDRSSLFAFSLAAFLVGGLSHLFGDILSAPDISTPIEPFWPFFNMSLAVDVVWYNAWWINIGFLTVMVVIHLVLAYYVTPTDHRYRLAS